MKNLSEITHELDVVTKKYVDDAAEAKVDKVEGKQLSTNDFTNEEKQKLADLSASQYELPIASADALGGVKIGANLNIDENGVLSANDQPDLTNYVTKEYVDQAIAEALANISAGSSSKSGLETYFGW